jgi:hypothetical protein|tara:strand:+ start:100 stop:390 length:291 start_codon:yes stop_codon:yes gene_type:complete
MKIYYYVGILESDRIIYEGGVGKLHSSGLNPGELGEDLALSASALMILGDESRWEYYNGMCLAEEAISLEGVLPLSEKEEEELRKSLEIIVRDIIE